jgi:hypothetical protein
MKIGGKEVFPSEAFKFRTAVANAAEQEWLSEKGRCAPPPRPPLALIKEFMEEKLARAAWERDWRQAIEALGDLRMTLDILVSVGHQEFAGLLKEADAGLWSIIKLLRDSLVRDFLNPATPPERAEEIKAGLIDLAEHGGWQNWREDLDNMIWERVEQRFEALRHAQQEDMSPWDWAC